MGFHVISASAGSGKTYNMTLSVLEILLARPEPRLLREILALTFTNKAARKMTDDLRQRLTELAEGRAPHTLVQQLTKTTGLSAEQLRDRAKTRLNEMLFRYDDLHYSTIDKFSFSLIRNFSKELGIGHTVTVEMKEDETVDQIIRDFLSRLDPQKHSDIIEELTAFMLYRLEDEMGWDVFKPLAELKKFILPDKYAAVTEHLAKLKAQDIKEFQKTLYRQRKQAEKELQTAARELLHEIESRENAVLKHYKTLIEALARLDFPNASQTYRKIFPEGQKEKIFKAKASIPEESKRKIFRLHDKVYALFKTYGVSKILLRQFSPMVWMHHITDEIQQYKSTHNVIFIHDFHKIIRRVVKDNPAPFIYFRAGQQFRHHFIDEFQDTSVIQWENMKPLIAESLSHGAGDDLRASARIYGDAKQSIYAFRGGDPEQFIRLTLPPSHPLQDDPFAPMAPKRPRHLGENWRSGKNIVRFNNVFFSGITDDFQIEKSVSADLYRNAYLEKNLTQKPVKNFEGYVEMRMDVKSDEEHVNEIVELIRHLRNDLGYAYADIGILYRSGSKGIDIAEALSRAGIPFVSENNLILDQSAKVRLLARLAVFFITEDPADLAEALADFASVKNIKLTPEFYKSFENLSFGQIINRLSSAEISVDWKATGLYGFFSTLIRILRLDDADEQAYLKFFMSEINRMESLHMGLDDFRNRWDELKTESLEIPEGSEGVRLMTIHKSKGLDFPVVILAGANFPYTPKPDSQVWVPVNDNKTPVKFLPVRYSDLNKLVSYFDLYETERDNFKESRIYDSINMIYVAFTRAEEKLYVLADNGKNAYTRKIFLKRLPRILNLAGSEYDEEHKIYRLGSESPKKKTDKTFPDFTSTGFTAKHQIFDNPILHFRMPRPEEKKDRRGAAIRQGIRMHEYLARLKCFDEWEPLKKHIQKELPGPEADEITGLIEKLLQHPRLKDLWDCRQNRILTERSILANTSYRPDRLIQLPDGRWLVVDFKTGSPRPDHRKQMLRYKQLMEEGGYAVKEALLIYPGPNPRTKTI